MTRISAFSSPFLLGFDEVERALDRVSKGSGSGYPPYNIERLARTNDRPETLRITLAVAGFAGDDLEVSVEDRELTIRGRATISIAGSRRVSSSKRSCSPTGSKFRAPISPTACCRSI
jgi:HSP20 family molecular chaperone IbpA